jgi:hypothetical protein
LSHLIFFDVLETADKASGYMKTAWVVQSFNGATIRTRVFVKTSSSDSGVKYKIKIASEYAEKVGATAKDDELFKAWDRVLKKYSRLIPELQSRL